MVQRVFSPTLLLVDLSPVRLLAHCTVSCLASCTPPFLFLFFPLALTHFPSFFLKALLSPDRLAGDKTWSSGDERDIWEQDGERDDGHVPTRSASAGSVETLAARRWVSPPFFFLYCMSAASGCAAPVAQVSD